MKQSKRLLRKGGRTAQPSDEGRGVDESTVKDIENHKIDQDVRSGLSIFAYLLAQDDKGSLRFLLKSYKSDTTSAMIWESESNLERESCDALRRYFDRVGGRDKIFEGSGAASPPKRRRSETGADPPTKRTRQDITKPRISTTNPPKVTETKPFGGEWEDRVASIDGCEDSGDGRLLVYISWDDGQKTKHGTSIIYEKCPQKMLQFYERHVKFVRGDSSGPTQTA